MNPWEFARGNGGLALVVLAIVSPLLLVAIPVLFVWYVIRPTIKAAWRHPIAAGALALVVALVAVLGLVEAAGFLVGLALVLVLEALVWRLVDPAGFARWISGPVRRVRRRRLLRANWVPICHWHGLANMVMTGRGRRRRQTVQAPRLARRITGTWWRDRLTFRPLTGQSLDTWQSQLEGICTALGITEARVVKARRAGWFHLDLIHGDALANIVAPTPMPTVAGVDLRAVPIGLCEDGRPFCLRLAGNHILIIGATGSGKGSVLWGALHGVAPLVVAGLVRLWVIDPKGGMELGRTEPVAHAYADDTPAEMVELLEAAEQAMNAQALALKARKIRRHTPTDEFPLNVVVIDELIDITKFKGDLAKRADAALGALLRKGRAVGFVVIGAAAEPRMTAIPHRDGFPTRIGLRLATKAQVDLVFGDGIWERGARCETIPGPALGSDGIGYALDDGHREPVRFRAAWMDDPDVDAVIDAMTPPCPVQVLDLPERGAA